MESLPKREGFCTGINDGLLTNKYLKKFIPSKRWCTLQMLSLDYMIAKYTLQLLEQAD